MILLTILGVTISALLIISVLAVAVGGSALIIGFGDIILYGLAIVIIVKLITNAVKNKKQDDKKNNKRKKK